MYLFLLFAYYCWLTIRFAVLLHQTFIGWIEEKIRQQDRVELRLMPMYAFIVIWHRQKVI
ncbi:hypothetical protein [Tolypothrix sp. VBCCA 56010]|uniref:hypothetical protein n=1 Tax=Tolypothrix sp. VBCCA 56010 TaxID=3137731 RepID=UPI003D7CCD1B